MLDSGNPIETLAQKFFVVLGTRYGNLDQIADTTSLPIEQLDCT